MNDKEDLQMEKRYQVLRCGRLYDGITPEWKTGQSILIEDDHIAEIGNVVNIPEGARIIDLTDCQVTPGMIDAHMHMDFFDWHTVREEVYSQSEEAKTLAIARCAEKALRRLLFQMFPVPMPRVSFQTKPTCSPTVTSPFHILCSELTRKLYLL